MANTRYAALLLIDRPVLLAAVQRELGDGGEIQAFAGRDISLQRWELAVGTMYVAFVDPTSTIWQALPTLIRATSPRIALIGGLCATLSAAQASLGDVVVPSVIVDSGSAASVVRTAASPAVLSAARALKTEAALVADYEQRPDGGTDPPRLRFGDVSLYSGPLVERSHDAPPLAITAAIGGDGFTQVLAGEDLLFGRVLAVTDSADAVRSRQWQPYAAEVAAKFALRLASRLLETTSGLTDDEPQLRSILPSTSTPAGSFLCKAHASGFDPLEIVSPPNDTSAKSVRLARSARAALFEVIASTRGPNEIIPESLMSQLLVTVLSVRKSLLLVDFATPNERLRRLGIGVHDRTRRAVVQAEWASRLIAAGFHGWTYPSPYAPGADWAGIELFPSALERIEVRGSRPATLTLEEREHGDLMLVDLLRGASER